MPCPVCDRTMQNLGSPDRRIWWCGYCGTLKEESGKFVRYEMPGMLRQIAATANLPPKDELKTSQTNVEVNMRVKQVGDEPTPQIEAVIFDPATGKRVL